MRLSLMLHREPFPLIFEHTLASFLLSWTRKPHKVHWCHGPPFLAPHRDQFWLVNGYLNAVFIPRANPKIFDTVTQEFSRSLFWWRRWSQRLYVDLAASRLLAKWLAHASVSISPPLAEAEQILIVPGNHKIRLLDYGAGTVYSIRKSGFSPTFLKREIEVRRQAEELGLPVPPLKMVAPDYAWCSEEYLSGTPVNRVRDATLAWGATRKAYQALHLLHKETFQEAAASEYVGGLLEGSCGNINANGLMTSDLKHSLTQTVNSLGARIRSLLAIGGDLIPTVLSHGDFQPANILVDGDRIWLIDWEYAMRRQAGYDAMTFMLGSRFPKGLAHRLHKFLMQEIPDNGLLGNPSWYVSCFQSKKIGLLYGSLFMLEEMALRLEENNNALFVRLDKSIDILQQEISNWLN